jgi:aryl-alcohol dehydrogenase-like predicted oxidoreductase
VRLKRAGDNGVVELDAADAYAVPVSRSRVGWLKSRMGSKPSEVAHQSP